MNRLKNYEPGSASRQKLQVELKNLAELQFDIPIIIGGKEIGTGKRQPVLSRMLITKHGKIPSG
jgi:1-pyrroline-5-carboxylate dehydrogenase